MYKNLDIDMNEINSCLKIMQKIREDANNNKKWGFDLKLEDFAKAMLCLNPQSYGSRIDNRLSNDLFLSKSDDLDRRDKLTAFGEYIEWKGSIFTSCNSFLNLVQIRPWQNTNYIYYAFDLRDFDNIKIQLFYLNKDQMDLELKNSSSAHGTKKSNLNNINNELAIRICVDSVQYNDWIKQYGISFENLLLKLNSKF
jgi:hypothetical protein